MFTYVFVVFVVGSGCGVCYWSVGEGGVGHGCSVCKRSSVVPLIMANDALGRDGGSVPMKETAAGHSDDGAENYDLLNIFY